ncbi:unnamed protein product [Rotaria socialis]|uniref:RNA helicase n=1 Tax=Rotaria socialis TaxID=392032 RepID=A0A820V1U0_9BILA|nr:unnamed protein product [Rotaria socialis]CAF3526900.1 unnamed protein product [Rotaria socialis]CAF3770453.1 unnamed protein product [Rotaria socialis]CAF4494416.1 unnamed protein product [Rotaria socialis]CAF4497565.1 unnamed protein product [Rotaria socialis]
MFVLPHSIRHLFKTINIQVNSKQLTLQSFSFVRYKTKLNLIRSTNEFNINHDDNYQSNENSQDLGSFKHFNISEATQKRLKVRNVECLFPVQYRSYNDISSGKDCIVQAHTGTGKTLAFSLPIVERLQSEVSNINGRYPRCLVLEPTRELAKQVTNDFLSIASRLLSISTIYGGKEYSQQELSLKRGSDVVIGTPGRIKDFINRKILILNQCQIIVLDEVDRILDMGFQDDVDFIIKNIYGKEKKSQMIVFSATIPLWLKKNLSNYMSKTNLSFINLIDDQQEKTANNIEHLSFKLNQIEKRSEIILKLFKKYSKDVNKSQAIIFCQTKQECDFLGKSYFNSNISSDVLHGNLSQRKREYVLTNFRQGRIRLLITTDLSARGLDIPDVDLVILTSPPQDWESYVHRSGRTGRAGKNGKAITIFNQQQMKQLKIIQTNTNMEFINIHPNSLD